MGKLFTILRMTMLLFFLTMVQQTVAQQQTSDDTTVPSDSVVQSTEIQTLEQESQVVEEEEREIVEAPSFHQILKQRFIEGGPFFMGIVLVALILGLAIAIERIIYLNMATTNTKKLVLNVDEALNASGVDAAKELCKNTKGPVASIFYQGLDRIDEGIESAEKSVIGYGGVQMGLFRKKCFLAFLCLLLWRPCWALWEL